MQADQAPLPTSAVSKLVHCSVKKIKSIFIGRSADLKDEDDHVVSCILAGQVNGMEFHQCPK